jgi:hypothetical protein
VKAKSKFIVMKKGNNPTEIRYREGKKREGKKRESKRSKE